MTPPDPADRHAIYHAIDIDFRLNPDGQAVNAGIRIPNVNDSYRGSAPDLGALESGDELPVYGPRNLDIDDPFYR
jgi:hypothetical protein